MKTIKNNHFIPLGQEETRQNRILSSLLGKRTQRKAFTLVELIIVITILAILATIAFVSFQGYSIKSRDSVRLSDISIMKTGLELFQASTGNYPLPTDGTEITYSGATVWIQGMFGKTVTTNLSRLNQTPTDPRTQKEYVYSTTNTRGEYQLAGVMEGEIVVNSEKGLVNSVFAGDITATLKISGTFNGKVIKSSTGGVECILALPSIITTSGTTLEEILSNDFLAYNGYKNLPFQYEGIFKTKGEASLKLVNTGSIAKPLLN